MNNTEILIVIIICAVCSFLTRALPFLIFRDADQLPKRLRYISEKLPLAIMFLLVLYCLRSTVFITYPYCIPQLCGVLIVILLHMWKRNLILSIGGGTICYMVLIQVIFI